MTQARIDEAQGAVTRIQDRPNWLYLLRDFYEVYRHTPAGGSAKIRAHQRAVREKINRVIKANAEVRERPGRTSPSRRICSARSTMAVCIITRR